MSNDNYVSVHHCNHDVCIHENGIAVISPLLYSLTVFCFLFVIVYHGNFLLMTCLTCIGENIASCSL